MDKEITSTKEKATENKPMEAPVAPARPTPADKAKKAPTPTNTTRATLINKKSPKELETEFAIDLKAANGGSKHGPVKPKKDDKKDK